MYFPLVPFDMRTLKSGINCTEVTSLMKLFLVRRRVSMSALDRTVWRHSNFQSETSVFRAELNQRRTWSRMDIETAVRSFVAWLLWCEALQLHLTGRHDNETLWIEVLPKTAEMRVDKAKKTGKDEIDGWNVGEGAGGSKERIQKQSNKVYKNHFSNLNKIEFEVSSSSSSVGATTLGGFWPALRFCSTIFYLYTSLSNFSLSSSLNPLLLGQAISVLVFLLVLMNMVPIQLVF